MRRNEILWGGALVVIGGVLLLDHLFAINLGRALGPLLLILLGFWLVWTATRRGEPLEIEEASIPLEDVERVHLRLKHGLGELSLHGGTDTETLLSGRFVGGLRRQVTRSGGSLRVALEPRVGGMRFSGFHTLLHSWPRAEHGLSWDLALNTQVPLYIEVEGGLSRSRFDLSDLDVRSFRLKGGLAATEITLPARAANTQVRIEGGLASVQIFVPEGVAARIRTRGGLANSDVDPRRFPQVSGVFISPHYDDAEHRVDLEIEQGLGSVTVR